MRKQFHPWFRVLALAVLMATLLLAGCSVASHNTLPSISSGPIVDKAPDDGIKVHGHWTIEVRNPDGTLVERREFNNALYAEDGREFLVKLLSRQTSVGGWFIRLHGQPVSEHAFMDGSSRRTHGVIAESTNPSTGPNIFKTLTVSIPTSGDYAGRLVLSGTATAQVNGNIGFVQTEIIGLGATEVPSASYSGTSYTFTGTTLSSFVTLTAGQQVVVTVAINFS
jgi:hypothetical protein